VRKRTRSIGGEALVPFQPHRPHPRHPPPAPASPRAPPDADSVRKRTRSIGRWSPRRLPASRPQIGSARAARRTAPVRARSSPRRRRAVL